MQKTDIRSKNVTNAVGANCVRSNSKGITLVALVITIIVMLILIGVTVITVLKGDLFNIAKRASVETRASMVEEKVAEWKANKKIDEYLEENSKTQKTIDDLLNELEEQKLITEEEKNTIIQTGRITIGSTEIVFDKIILPEGYTRLEYLESTGTQYIDTEYILSSDSIVNIFIKHSYNQFGVIYGSFDTNNAGYNRYAVYITNKDIYYYYGSYKKNQHTIASKVFYPTNEYKITVSSQGIEINGDLLTRNIDSTESFVCKYNALVFSCNSQNFSGTGNNGRMRLSRIEIYDMDVLKRCLWPVLDTNGIPCMYDTVSGQTFYNKGTGEFIAGYKN